MNRVLQEGVSPQSTIFFHTSGSPLPEFLYYPVCIGHYYCSPPYLVSRSNYDSFLILYSRRGTGIIEADSISKRISSGEVCLIDCYRPHKYMAEDFWELEWLHFDGIGSRSFFEYLKGDEPFFHTLLESPTRFEEEWNHLYEMLLRKDTVNELLLSQSISNLLTMLGLSAQKSQKTGSTHDFLDASLKYIHRRLGEDITLDQLAAQAALSPFYFTRKFKEGTGYTPYRYILISRINLAKFYLKSSADSVKNIGFSCGFHSEHSFCTSFKKELGMTPTEYREQK